MKKLLFTALLLSLYVPSAFATPGVNDWSKTAPLESLYIDDGRDKIEYNFQAIDRLQSNYRRGCGIKYNTVAQVTVEDGELMVSNAAGTTRVMMQNTADTTVTWADIDTGAEEASTRYYLYAVASGDDDKIQEYVISKSATSPTGYTYYRRLGNFYNDASSNISEVVNDDPVTKAYHDSGWFSASSGSTTTKSHTLKTQNCISLLFYSSDSSGSNMAMCMIHTKETGYTWGSQIQDITTSQYTVQSGAQGIYRSLDSSGSGSSGVKTSGFLRVILVAL